MFGISSSALTLQPFNGSNSPSDLRYASLLVEILRLELYALRSLPPLRLRTLGPRPSLPSLCSGAAGRPQSALRRNELAANHHGVGRVRAARLLHIPSWFQLK